MASVIAPSITVTRSRAMDDTLPLTRYVILSLTRSNVECPSELAWKFRSLVSNVRNDKKLLLTGSCHQVSLNNDNAQATFFAIGDELFEDSINWGRIVTFYAFAVEVAAFFIQKGQNVMVNNVISWTALFVDQKLSAWIKHEGGWVSIVVYKVSQWIWIFTRNTIDSDCTICSLWGLRGQKIPRKFHIILNNIRLSLTRNILLLLFYFQSR